VARLGLCGDVSTISLKNEVEINRTEVVQLKKVGHSQESVDFTNQHAMTSRRELVRNARNPRNVS
jgi:hypothetical protein